LRLLAALLFLSAICGACSDATTSSSAAQPDGGSSVDVPDGGEPVDPDGGTLPDGAPLGKTLTFMTLNLHGYHAMNEKPRYFEDRAGAVTEAASSPFYFTRAELDRGNAARLDALANDLTTRLPDVIALQEVGAGSPDVARDCATFDNAPLADSPSANTARRLAARLSAQGYSVEVACRGNVGWNTDASTFKDRRIVTLSGSVKTVVHEFDSNPYPGGILVEGFGLLYRAPLKATDATTLDVVINSNGEHTKAQLVALESEGKSIVVVNVHGGHKVQHFEQAVAIRKAVSDYLVKKPGPHRVVFLGDFNSRLHRPNNPVFLDEPSIVPWEIEVKGEYSYRDASSTSSFTALRDKMRALNASTYKSFATLPEGEANARIDAAIGKLRSWIETKPEPLVFTEALSSAAAGACKPPKTGFGACETDARIDHLFFAGGLSLVESHALYVNADDHLLSGTYSDHPAVSATLGLDP
jgi:endonuclease/exonuclease/phosphatase family metal-dependent hydrolase